MRDGVEFTAECGPDARRCHTGGHLRLWADEVVREHLGDRLVLLNPTIDASMDFISFDGEGVPLEVVGSIAVSGELRSRIGNVVVGYPLSTTLVTGGTADPRPTTLDIVGNRLVIGEVTLSSTGVLLDEQVEFGVSAVGTTTMIELRLRAEVDFHNLDGGYETGVIVAHLRLRR